MEAAGNARGTNCLDDMAVDTEPDERTRNLDAQQLQRLIDDIASGKTSPADAFARLRDLPYSEVADETGPVHARVDHHRALRCGFPEVIFSQGKTVEQVRSIASELLGRSDVVLATRASAEQAEAVIADHEDARWHEAARVVIVDRREEPPSEGLVVVATGGTADIPVAEEAALCAEVMGCRVERLYDVGVAGVHRVLANADVLRSARAVIAVAGMEGALPSVVAGLVDVPVVAVPTSVGYGANLGGFSALLTMLNSCAAGISVVNIDNGFGAAVVASRVNRPGWLASGGGSAR